MDNSLLIEKIRNKFDGVSPKAYVRSFGCQLNTSDGEKIKGLLGEMGCSFTNDEKEADIIILNTCAVRENAEDRVFGIVGSMKKLKELKPSLIMGISGCMTAQSHIAEKIKEEDLNTVGAVSSKVAYQMALDLLNNGCDISISTTGYAGPDTDEFGNQLGLYFIGIGMKTGVDVYKYRGSGNREEITETAKNTALFLAIKKLKNI